MAGSGKQKTTMAKRNREAKMRERKMDKQARKEDRKRIMALPADHPDRIEFEASQVSAADVDRALLAEVTG